MNNAPAVLIATPATQDAVHARDFEAETGTSRLGIDPRAIWRAVIRWRIWIAAITGAFLALGILYLLLSSPKYLATASVQIDQEAAKVLGTEDTNLSASIQDSDRFLQTQLDVVRSRALTISVANSLKLFDNPSFLTRMNVNNTPKPLGVLDIKASMRERVIKTLSENLSINLPFNSRVASISFVSPDPKLAADVANTYAKNFIVENLQRKFDTSAYARDFLGGQLSDAKARLEQSEQAVVAYAAANRIVDVSSASGLTNEQQRTPKSLLAASLVELNSRYSEALGRKIATEQKWRQARSATLFALPDVLSNTAIQELLQQRAVLRGQLQEQRERRKDDYPVVRQLTAQLTELSEQINTLAANIRSSIRSDFEVATAQETGLRRALDDLKTANVAEQQRSVQLSILQRSADTNKSMYESLMQRFRELSSQAGVQANNVAIIDRADVPAKPVSPKVPLVLALSLLAGLATSGAFVFAAQHLDDTLRSPDDVQSKLQLPFLGAIPEAESGDVFDLLSDPKSPVSEAYASVRAALSLSTSHGLPRSLLISSSQPAEGKSTTAYALAYGLARLGKRTIIVDMDLRRPSQQTRFKTPRGIGASEALAGVATLDECIQHSNVENLDYISSGGVPPNPAELLNSPALKTMIDDLTQRYDVVIVDAPPVMGLADAVLLGAVVERVVFVAEAGRSHLGGSRTATQRLTKAGSTIIGVVLTRYDASSSGAYAYNYSYAYGSTNK